MAVASEGLRQKCDSFYSINFYKNTNFGDGASYYTCEILGQLENDEDEVSTDTSENTKSNAEVTAVYYNKGHTVKLIPNSLFETFVNLKYFFIHFNNKFETMKREYLRNATKLKNFHIYQNSVKKIDGNVFSEAKSLEHINFRNNKIESIHKEAFNGLPNLQGIYLYENNIKNLHPQTFSSIGNLNVLGLKGDENCVNEDFTSANQKISEVEGKISSNCTYEEIPCEVAEENRIKIQEANDKIGNLTAEAQAKQEKIEEMTNKLEELKAQLSSQEEKHVKELANQQKEFAYEKLEMKFTQMEAKLTDQKTELLQECKWEVLKEIARHSFENGKLADQMATLQNMYLSLVDRISGQQSRLAVLERKND